MYKYAIQKRETVAGGESKDKTADDAMEVFASNIGEEIIDCQIDYQDHGIFAYHIWTPGGYYLFTFWGSQCSQ